MYLLTLTFHEFEWWKQGRETGLTFHLTHSLGKPYTEPKRMNLPLKSSSKPYLALKFPTFYLKA